MRPRTVSQGTLPPREPDCVAIAPPAHLSFRSLLHACWAGGLIPTIFRSELDAALLGDAITSALDVLQRSESGSVAALCVLGLQDWQAAGGVLLQLSRTGGFEMAREFLVKADIEVSPSVTCFLYRLMLIHRIRLSYFAAH